MTVVPRLFPLALAAQYLGLSEWSTRQLHYGGLLPSVKVPLPNGGELRKLLFDVRDLDRAIESWKVSPSS
jgi:hypothetical protein